MSKRRINKFLALILALSLMVSMLTVNMFVSAEDIVIWDGKTLTQPTQTDKDGNILITSPSEFAFIIKNNSQMAAGLSYKLVTDIYLNDITKINWETGVVADGYTANSWYVNATFSGGIIDGDGHVVYGLYYEGNPTEYTSHPNGTGLIPRLAAGADLTVKNLGLDNFYLNHINTVGAFLGTAMGKNGVDTGGNILFSSCYAGASGTLKGAYAGVFRGNAYKEIATTTITDCYSLASVTGTRKGFMTNTNDPRFALTFTNCYNANGPLCYGSNIGYYGKATNCYATELSQNASGGHQLTDGVTLLTTTEMQGENTTMALGDAFTLTDSYPVLKVFDKSASEEPEEPEDPDEPEVPARPTMPEGVTAWDGTLTEPKDSDSDGWLEITNGSELAYAIKNGGGADNKYILTADIYLNDISKIDWATGVVDPGYAAKNWYDHGKTFQGTIDGDGHVVYGLYTNLTPTASGLYGSALIPKITDNGSVTINALGVDYAYISHHNASAFVAAAQGATLVMDNCYLGSNVKLIGLQVGAFRAYAKNTPGGSISNCYSLATLEGSSNSGLIGLFWDASNSLVITNCYNGNGPISTHGGNGQADASNNYASVAGAFTEGVTVVATENMKGANALTNMPNIGNAYVVVDDGYFELKSFFKLSASKDGKNYVGKYYDEYSDYYVNLTDSSDYFWRYDHILVDEDDVMDICDLVYLAFALEDNLDVDVNKSGATDNDDITILRKAIIGLADYSQKF